MAIKKTISLTNREDVVSSRTGNPVAERAILELAQGEELLVEGDGHLFAPVKRGERWNLERVLTEDLIVAVFRIPFHEAHRLPIEASVPVFRTRRGTRRN